MRFYFNAMKNLFFIFFLFFFSWLVLYERDIHQPNLPHHLASGDIPPVLTYYLTIKLLPLWKRILYSMQL
nr:MAG TPA: hypothetical protein [Crassvirales sp.]